MKQIQLTQGEVALIDDEDFEWLNKWKWCVTKNKKQKIKRVMRRTPYSDGKKRGLSLHRLLMGLQFGDKRCVDHINGNPLDNRKANLRICTNTQNKRNRGKQYNNKSGNKGVCWHKRRKKWIARIGHLGKRLHLGCYDNAQDAADAYNKKALELCEEFTHKTCNPKLLEEENRKRIHHEMRRYVPCPDPKICPYCNDNPNPTGGRP